MINRHYFDLTTFFKQESESLDKDKLKLFKQIIKDGAKEKKQFNSTNWLKELKPFIDCDINKPAWINSYQTDTVHLKKEGLCITYKAMEQALPVRSIKLTFSHNKVMDITIHKERHNFYYQSDDWYVYHSMKGYSISGSQNVRLLDKTNYQVIAVYVP